MTHARTLPRYVGIAGLVAGLLAPVPSLAAVNSNGIEILSTTATGVKNGTYIEAAASMAYQHVNTAERIYTKQVVPVATATLRRGALAALSRGVMHPGLQLAIMAAGFIWSQSDGILKPETPEFEIAVDDPAIYEEQPGVAYCFSGPSDCSPTQADLASKFAAEHCASEVRNCRVTSLSSDRIRVVADIKSSHGNWITNGGQWSRTYGVWSDRPATPYQPVTTGTTPVEEDDLPQLDPHIPPVLLDELVGSDDDIPEWEDEISVLPAPQSSVVPTHDQNVAPEVASAAGRWAENVAAQLEGQEMPHPETGTDGKTADDAMYEDWQQPVPPFGEVTPEWQVETIDALPDYDMGLGAGSCPAPAHIEVPLYGTITLDWQPICDLASILRGAVIGICLILSLYIVLGTRATTS